MKKPRLKINKSEQYESICDMFYFLDHLGLKEAWKANRSVVRVHGEYWEQCDDCGEPMGDHDEPCLDRDGNRMRRYCEDDIER